MGANPPLFPCRQIGHQVQLSLKSVHEDYRLRFGIESSYRMKNQCRIKTTTKNPIVRFLFVSLAFLIVNLWIYLLWRYISRSRRGGRLLFPKLFSLTRMLGFLRQAVDRSYGVVEAIHLPGGRCLQASEQKMISLAY